MKTQFTRVLQLSEDDWMDGWKKMFALPTFQSSILPLTIYNFGDGIKGLGAKSKSCKFIYKLIIALGCLFVISASAGYAVEISIPEFKAEPNEIIEIPVNVEEVAGIFSIELNIEYDAEVIMVGTVRSTDFTKNFLKATNIRTPGKILVSLASARPSSGQGAIVRILVKVKDKLPSGTESPLKLTKARLNEGAIDVTVTHGRVIVGEEVAVNKRQRLFSNWGKIKRGF